MLAGDRIAALDIYRGFALIGILIINIPAFALPGAAATGPFQIGTPTALDRAVVGVLDFLVEGTARGSFGLLFGAGVIILTSRLEAKGKPAADIHLRRNLWLVIFGAIHGYVLLWLYDILYTYGLVGILLFVFRKLRPRTLLILGALALVPIYVPTPMDINAEFEKQVEALALVERVEAGDELTEEEQDTLDDWVLERDRLPDEEKRTELTETFRGGYAGIFADRAPKVFEGHTSYFYTTLLWDSAAFMLIGMGLCKLGVITGEKSSRFYLMLALVAYGIGAPLQAANYWFMLTDSIEPAARSYGWWFYDARRLAMTLGHLGLVMLFAKTLSASQPARTLASMGRMALTMYIGQTVICSLLFYGFGFGLFGKINEAGLFACVIAIIVTQGIAARLWLARFRFGPLEWAWRSLTYWKRQPFIRQAGSQPEG